MTAQKPTYEELEQRIKYLENPELDREKALDVVALNLAEVVDTGAIQSLMDDFFSLTNIGVAILDLNGKVLVATGWQDICTKFHRIHPESSKNRLKSDLELSNGVEPGTFRLSLHQTKRASQQAVKVYPRRGGKKELVTPCHCPDSVVVVGWPKEAL